MFQHLPPTKSGQGAADLEQQRGRPGTESRQTDRQGLIDRHVDGQTDRHVDGQPDTLADRKTCRQTGR